MVLKCYIAQKHSFGAETPYFLACFTFANFTAALLANVFTMCMCVWNVPPCVCWCGQHCTDVKC